MADKKDMWNKFSILSTIIAVLGALIGGLLFYTQQREIQLTGIEFTIKAPPEQRTKEIEQIVAQISQIEDKLTSLTKVPKDLPIAPKIAEIEADIASLKENMAGINSVIMETPQKVAIGDVLNI